jgi:hypothetical protein
MERSFVTAACLVVAQALLVPAAAQAPWTSLAACPKAIEVTHAHMLGLWRAEFADLAPGATLLLEQHPELAQSVRGAINRNGEQALLAGDVDEGAFTLEESTDGVHINATWIGDVVEDSCGREIRGSWEAAKDKRPLPFVLRRQ